MTWIVMLSGQKGQGSTKISWDWFEEKVWIKENEKKRAKNNNETKNVNYQRNWPKNLFLFKFCMISIAAKL